MKKIILMTNDNKLLLSKDETSKNVLIDKSLVAEFINDELIIKLSNDYKNNWDLEVTNNGDVLI